MGAGDEAEFFEIGHDIAHRCGGQIESGILRQQARADRLTVGNIAFNQGLEQGAGAFVEHGGDSTKRRDRAEDALQADTESAMTKIMAPAAKPRMRDARMWEVREVRHVAFDAMGEFEQGCMMHESGKCGAALDMGQPMHGPAASLPGKGDWRVRGARLRVIPRVRPPVRPSCGLNYRISCLCRASATMSGRKVSRKFPHRRPREDAIRQTNCVADAGFPKVHCHRPRRAKPSPPSLPRCLQVLPDAL